jgi:hypothetical protein
VLGHAHPGTLTNRYWLAELLAQRGQRGHALAELQAVLSESAAGAGIPAPRRAEHPGEHQPVAGCPRRLPTKIHRIRNIALTNYQATWSELRSERQANAPALRSLRPARTAVVRCWRACHTV